MIWWNENDSSLPKVIDIPTYIEERKIKQWISDKYGHDVESFSKLTHSENIAYLCTEHIKNFKEEAELVRKLMDMQKVCLYWTDEKLDNAIRKEIELYCKKHWLNKDNFKSDTIFELTYKFV